MPSIKERVAAFFQSLIPVRTITRYDSRNEPSALAQTLDVDRVHQILRNAEAGDTSDLFALYRDVLLSDSHLQAEFTKRKLAVLGDPLSFQALDKSNPDDATNAAFIADQVSGCADWIMACSHLLDSCLWPVAVLEKVYRPSALPGQRYELARLVPVPDQLLDYTTGKLRLRDTDPATGMIAGTFHDPDPTRYIVHRGHLLTIADNWGGPMRSIIFWWLLSTMDRDWWARFLERYGSPFMVGRYDQADDASRSVLERAFGLAVKLGGLVVSKQTEVELKQAASSDSADAYEKFHTIANREKSKVIVGQTLSAEAQSTGLGSGVSRGQENVRQDIRQFDAVLLGTTLRSQLFDQLLRINGRRGRSPKPIWGAESYDNAKIIGEILSNMATAGIEPTDDALPVLSERLGFAIRRRAALPSFGQSPFGVALAADPRSTEITRALDAIARNGSADLARAFRGHLAPIRQMILSARSPDELRAMLATAYADWPAAKLSPIIENALVAYAANGTS